MRGERLPGVMRGVSPCTECTERHIACHDNCSQYKEWKAEAQKIKAAKRNFDNERSIAYREFNRRTRWQRMISKKD